MTPANQQTADAPAAAVSAAITIRRYGPAEIPAPTALATAWCGGQDHLRAAAADGVRWLQVLRCGLQHVPYLIEARAQDRVVGALPLALVASPFFGRFLVSLPYVNSAGAVADQGDVAERLVDAAVELAEQCRVRYLELRQERELRHAALPHQNTSKVLMRLPLPSTADALWNGFKSKLRSQIRSGEKHHFVVSWGSHGCLSDFYDVFSRNMRDLGTPVYPRRFFSAVLAEFGDRAELCVVRLQGRAVASALLLHAAGASEVPSASSLRQYNATNANMVMYWHLLQRAIERQQPVFDFGRSSTESNTYRFKKQWGAEPSPSVWQYHLRRGTIGDMRPDNAKYGLAIRTWQRLPVWLTRLIGPTIVRGIP